MVFLRSSCCFFFVIIILFGILSSCVYALHVDGRHNQQITETNHIFFESVETRHVINTSLRVLRWPLRDLDQPTTVPERTG